MRKILLAMLSLVMLVGLAMSIEPLEVRSESMQFNYEDSVSGNGNFASNNKMTAQGPHTDARMYSRLSDAFLQKKDHGSGSIDRETIMSSTKSIMIQIDPDMVYAYGLVAAFGNNSMVYEPQTMSIGTGYYISHPVNFNSLLGDKIQIKNYASETSMVYEAKQAKATNKDFVASVEDDYSGWNPSKSLTRTLMNLNGSVNSGTAHVGMLQGNRMDFDKSAFHNPDITLEEDYTGTFDIATNMNLTIPVYKTVSEDSWLPCCFSGWDGMNYANQKDFGIDAKGIFDCTCPKVDQEG